MIDENMIKEEYVDQRTAAQMLNVTQARISQLCPQGRFPGAIKIGWSWIIPKEAIKNFKPSPRGPKPKKRNNETNNNLKGDVDYDKQ